MCIRDRYMGTLLGLFFTLGEIFTCVIAYLCLKYHRSPEGEARTLLGWTAFPCLIAWFMCLCYIDESPRYALINGDHQDAYRTIDKMFATNKDSSPTKKLTQLEKEKLAAWGGQQALKQSQGRSESSFSSVLALFSPQNLKISLIMLFGWFAVNFCYYGHIFIMPLVLSKMRNSGESGDPASTVNTLDDVVDLMYSSIAELPSSIVAAYMAETPIFGRKNSITYTFGLAAACSLFSAWNTSPGLVFWSSAARFLLNVAFILIYQYTTEVYPTRVRATGLGIGCTVGKTGCVLMPYILIWLINAKIEYVYLGLTLISGLAAFLNSLLPFDTRDRVLDGHH
eukprot:TRINITY_DN647_c0_g1_i1.p1 TRINITY_DN647_c0_g1~~TRINITY_DN647_c0_g1_i1.p1  ORF type:complete len:339 (-),score=72.04 TRINITY_DN647_c0_g1_i1:274-1290(-)